MGLALLGEKLSAEQAEEWGLIWKCVDDDAAAADGGDAGAQLAAGPTLGYVKTRQAIDAGEIVARSGRLDLERDLQRELGQRRLSRRRGRVHGKARAALHGPLSDAGPCPRTRWSA
jgi:enoyl-CoA hydratase/carnithine racemase